MKAKPVNLIEALNNFSGAKSYEEESLDHLFDDLAKIILFGGHFLVNNTRVIEVTDVEFYYHEEKENGYKDRIMYHRNKESEPKREEPYFPVGSLNAHVSGIDITFENEDKQFRASALIRGFRIKGNKESENRSTYMYEALMMGIPLTDGIHIEWIDNDGGLPAVCEYTQTVRHNVCKYIERKNAKGQTIWEKKPKSEQGADEQATKDNKYVQDMRQWRYIRCDK